MAICRHCKSVSCVKIGRQKNGKQRFRCRVCRKSQQADYSYTSYSVNDSAISEHVKEGVGIRSTGRLLKVSRNTVLSRIRRIAKTIKPPSAYKPNEVYEMDELHTYIGSKEKALLAHLRHRAQHQGRG